MSEAFVDIPFKLVEISGYENESKRIGRTRSNHVVLIKNSKNTSFTFVSNQRLREVIIQDCVNCKIIFLDSVVNVHRTCRLINCDQMELVLEDVDIRRVECYNVTNSKVVVIDSVPLVENQQVYWIGECSSNKLNLSQLERSEETYEISYFTVNETPVPDNNENEYISYFDDTMNQFHVPFRVNGTLTPKGEERFALLRGFVVESDLEPPSLQKVLDLLEKWRNEDNSLSNEELEAAYDLERSEYFDTDEIVREKVAMLAKALQLSNHAVVYTGAGISTSANIPDFRGPQGAWTLKDKGIMMLNYVEKVFPTLSHYAITELTRRGLVKFVITTNMDALHLRSGLPAHLICEQHGNKHIERCDRCGSEFKRQYNTLETVVNVRGHLTGRYCEFCKGPLKDTIVHFSETLTPENMLLSMHHARKCDLAVVLGTSMNVHPAASFPDKCFKNGGKLVIVNLQKTPYDNLASIRIFAKIDVVMKLLMEELGIFQYDVSTDKLLAWDPPEGIITPWWSLSSHPPLIQNIVWGATGAIATTALFLLFGKKFL